MLTQWCSFATPSPSGKLQPYRSHSRATSEEMIEIQLMHRRQPNQQSAQPWEGGDRYGSSSSRNVQARPLPFGPPSLLHYGTRMRSSTVHALIWLQVGQHLLLPPSPALFRLLRGTPPGAAPLCPPPSQYAAARSLQARRFIRPDVAHEEQPLGKEVRARLASEGDAIPTAALPYTGPLPPCFWGYASLKYPSS